ncbi:hypothetical protein [Nocardia sp. CA-120079]|uniref:hypothetical protein n=1 Tax=Nocardia sp. CA-120079 TaxID=3239974 RepID=UPI003D97BAFA
MALLEVPERGTADELAELGAVSDPEGVHTTVSASQFSDGAAAVLLASAERAGDMRLSPSPG